MDTEKQNKALGVLCCYMCSVFFSCIIVDVISKSRFVQKHGSGVDVWLAFPFTSKSK